MRARQDGAMRRTYRTVVAAFGVALLIAVGLLAADEFWVDIPGLTDCDTVLCCETCENIPVTRVIDGDTFVSGPFRVRLFGVDTPEVGQRCASEATARLRKLAGVNVRVELGPRAEDRFGRLLYYVYTDSGDSIDETLVAEGLAVAWTRDGQHRDYLVGVEQRARSADVGCLW